MSNTKPTLQTRPNKGLNPVRKLVRLVLETAPGQKSMAKQVKSKLVSAAYRADAACKRMVDENARLRREKDAMHAMFQNMVHMDRRTPLLMEGDAAVVRIDDAAYIVPKEIYVEIERLRGRKP